MTEEKKVDPKAPKVDPLDIVNKTNAAAARLEAANAKSEELANAAAEAKIAENLEGTADAGGGDTQKTEDEKWAEEAKVRYAGTGMDPTDEEVKQ